MPLISVIIPMRNAEPFISATLTSILQEDGVPFEVIVVNDGSTDASLQRVEAVKDNRIRVVDGPCKGFAAASNFGMAEARGEIIMRCDADDLYPPNRLVRQVEWLEKHLEFGAVSGSFSTIDVQGNLIAKLNQNQRQAEEITEELKSGIIRNHFCTYAIRAEIWQELGGLRPALNGAADLDLQLRLAERCRVWYLPEVEYYYRLHGASLTHTQKTSERKFFDSLILDLQRQRRDEGKDDLQCGRPLPSPPQDSDGAIETAKEHTQGMLMGRAWQEHQNGKKWEALKTGVRSVLVRPQSLTAWRSLAALAVKPSGKTSGYNPSAKKER